jgi:hypothetical protein
MLLVIVDLPETFPGVGLLARIAACGQFLLAQCTAAICGPGSSPARAGDLHTICTASASHLHLPGVEVSCARINTREICYGYP